jgi:hypothetical protein
MADPHVRATLAGVLLFAIGVAIGGGAIVNYQRERDAIEGWQRADGQVVELVQIKGKPRPLVSFSADGALFRFTPVGPLANRTYTVGDTVVVLYPLGQPKSAQLESTAIRWARTVYAGAGGILLMVLGGYVAWYARSQGLRVE